MKLIISIVSILFICNLGWTETDSLMSRGQGKYHGHEYLSQKIRADIFHTDDQFDLSYFLNGDFELTGFLGASEAEEGIAKKVNSDPNGVNVVLYYLVFHSLADSISKQCIDGPLSVKEPRYEFSSNETFNDLIDTLCSWPSERSQSISNLRNLWHHLMGFETSEAEFIAWQKFVRSSEELDPSKVTYEALLTLFLNPYYLLEK